MTAKPPLFKEEIQQYSQMMYIAGETQDVSEEVTTLIEDIIHGQVVHMLTTARDLAFRRGSRIFTVADLVFQFRHDAARVDRLRTFLVWKVIRKSAKSDDDKEIPEDEEPDVEVAPGMKAVPSVNFPWELPSFFAEQVPDADDGAVEALTSASTLEKLQRNDRKTQDMTVDEYATWCECRHASFTWRKIKRFRTWSGLGVIAEHRLGDDVPDVLGFITAEMVKTLTTEALVAQMEEGRGLDVVARNGPVKEGLFGGVQRSRNPVGARHVRIAFQRLQAVPKKQKAILTSTRLPVRQGLKLI
ncbi:transcription initiation factor IID, 18kD subunit-domain-containing protein [Plectosphaerella plurivora]|uniref:Transcription initiation factor IID, 18kD subunit-domain-containing protein n=1 Tax=Plectosphaerella plurivora TaxID=936078 RepID=A0A9P8VL37_9PEZI|nr:transcription initiation factor IID, 18kD subunit-domain-containing protein [Plectosphaerella plurivora]